MLLTTQKHTLFLNGLEVLTVYQTNNETTFFKVTPDNAGMQPVNKQEFLQTLEHLKQCNLIKAKDYYKLKGVVKNDH